MQVVLLEDIVGEKADELVKKCPVKVFDIEDIGKGKMQFVFLYNLYDALLLIASLL